MEWSGVYRRCDLDVRSECRPHKCHSPVFEQLNTDRECLPSHVVASPCLLSLCALHSNLIKSATAQLIHATACTASLCLLVQDRQEEGSHITYLSRQSKAPESSEGGVRVTSDDVFLSPPPHIPARIQCSAISCSAVVFVFSLLRS